MKRRIFALFLSLSMALSLLPTTAVAATSSGDVVQVSKKQYALAPGVTEYELITNNSAMNAQQVGHIMEITPDSSAELRVGYNDYNINAIKSGSNWAMVKPTEQAQKAEAAANVDVIGIVNGDGFNMSNGCPSGYTVMQGQVIRDTNTPCFWIDSKGTAHISANRAAVNAICEADGVEVRESIGGFAVLVQDGVRTSAGSKHDGAVHPRTVFGIKADGTVIIYMVDGRQAPYSVGMDYGDLADIMLNLGCVDVLNVDGGGSSVFATQREGEANSNGPAGLTIRCRPSDGYERSVSTSLMVISTAASDGQFDHASITPTQEIYTPGSTVQFTATGIDKAGRPADLPSGLSWTVVSGGGSIDTAGRYTGSDSEGAVTVALKDGDTTVGTATIELRWPDKLGFTNTSVSLDFGETSDLTFYPTYQGREVHYKDGDFEWTVENTDELSYKYTFPVESLTKPGWGGYTIPLNLSLNGAEGSTKSVTANYGEVHIYESNYTEGSKTITVDEEGYIKVSEEITHTLSKMWAYSGGALLSDNITQDVTADTSIYQCGISGIKETQTVTFSLGRFQNNCFTADSDNSLRGRITVSRGDLSAGIDAVVGMEPFVLMDFEDYTDPQTNVTTDAKKFWSIHVGSTTAESGPDANNKKNGALTLDEVKEDLLWIRDTTGRGVVWPKESDAEDAAEMNRVVSVEENSNVRFGNYAMRLAWDFSQINSTTVAVADFGFSSSVYVDTVQPQRIGMWIYVPKDLENDTSVLKAVMVGNASTKSSTGFAYRTLTADSISAPNENQNTTGTTTYVQYHSYDSEGNLTGSALKDWAGKGWTWVEADTSALQFPIAIERGYTVRITSPQNGTKGTGYILIDNLQLIYGTNTNDKNNPVITSLVETSTNTALSGEGETKLTKSTLSFEAVYHDNEQTDKYASGIDPVGVRILIDSVDYTARATVNAGNLLLSGVTLTNGSHTVTLTVKDYNGSITTERYAIEINDDAGADSLVTVTPQSGSPELGKTYSLAVTGTVEIDSADVTVQLPSNYLSGAQVVAGTGYTVSKTVDTEAQKVALHIEKIADASEYSRTLAALKLAVPGDAAEGAVLTYSIPAGSYSEAGGTASFSLPETSVALTAAYTLTAGQSVVGYPTTLTVTDAGGSPAAGVSVYNGNTVIGTTDADGRLSCTFDAAGRNTLYAKNSEGDRSWNTAVIVCAKTSNEVNNGAPFGIQNVAVANASTGAAFTWLSAIDLSGEQGYLRYAASEDGLTNAANVAAESSLITFAQATSGDALRLHTVKLTGLTPATTYYYQVGDGEKWSEALSFTTASGNAKADTDFVVLGDMQTNDTSRLVAALRNIAEGDYDFALQTGDVIDDVTVFSNWRALFAVMDAETLSVPTIHTLGNHEYYGDADGQIGGRIFALAESAQGSYYSVEYGSVYVGVINFGSDLTQALAKMKTDAAASDCEWKVLVLHEPVYGTREDMDATARRQITDAIEEAGIEFVFSGDDHALARTYPMQGGTKLAADSADGVVYYISGDLSSKDYDFTKYEHFAEAYPHSEYTGCYLTVSATATSFTVKAMDYTGNLLDSYTRTRTACQQGSHTFNEQSRYDLTSHEITCALCGASVGAEESGYTGMLSLTSGDGKVMLSTGTLKKNEWFAYGEDICHAGENGLLHETETKDTATCLDNGRLTSTCKTCSATYTGDATWAKGHSWNAEHICTTCSAQGIDIAQATLKTQYLYYSYTGSAIRPASTAVYDGRTLVAKSDRRGTDAYISYSNNTEIGVGTVTYEGRGNFYGEVSVNFTIVPASVSTITATDVGMHSITLGWAAAKGAQTYIIQRQTESGWVKVGETSQTSYTIEGLESEATYTYRVNTRTSIGGKNYYCLSYSNALPVTTIGDPSELSSTYIIGMDCKVHGITHQSQAADGKSYIFLPSSSDLNALDLCFTVSGSEAAITLSGDLGSLVLSGYEQTVDLKSLAAQESDGSYRLTVKLGSLRPMTVYLMRSSNLPAMYLTSDDPDSLGRSYVDAEKGRAVTARMQLVSADGMSVYDGALTQLKSRGNSTFTYYPKKSYQIKLATGADLLGTRETVKTWVLLAGYGDATQMHDKLFKDMAAALGMAYTASCDWVDLYYDGEYRGTYLLSEKVSVNPSSVDITDMEAAYEALAPDYGEQSITEDSTNAYGNDIRYTKDLPTLADVTGGYLLELNNDKIDEANGFHTSREVAFNIKSPEYSGADAVQYISEYYQAFEDAVYATDASGSYTGYNTATQKYYYDYCDLNSLVKMYLLQQLSLNSDSFASSLFFYKDAGGKLYAGPIWDMELTCGTGWTEELASSRELLKLRYLSEALEKIPSFQNAVKSYFKATFTAEVENLLGADGTISAYRDTLADSAAMNYVLWPYVRIGAPSAQGHLWADGTEFADVTDDLSQWLQDRLNVMKGYYSTGTGDSSSGGGSSAGGGTVAGGAASITVPVNSAHGSVEVEATVSKGTATVEVSDKQVEEVIADGAGSVTLDVSGLKNVESATVPSHVVEKTNEAENTGLTVALPTGSVSLDETALESVTENANGKDVTVSVVSVPTANLSPAVKDIIGMEPTVVAVVDVNVIVNGVKQSSFNGGKVTVSIPYTPKAGEDTSKLAVWFIKDDGTIENMGGYYDAKSGCFVFETEHLSQYLLVNTNELVSFTDVSADAWYTAAVNWAVKQSITGGIGNDQFGPDLSCTRAQLVTFLWRAAGQPVVNYAMSFTDVDEGEWYGEAVRWAASLGIVGGYGNGLFGTNDEVLREQVAAILYRYAVAMGMDVSAGEDTNILSYSDALEVSEYAVSAFQWACGAGIVNGSDGKLMPNDNCTRGQIVTMLYRLLGE